MTDSRSAGVPEGGHVDVGERAEPDALRPEAAERGHPPEEVRRRRVSWRSPVAAVPILLGCLLAPISVVAVWTANQVPDPNRYVVRGWFSAGLGSIRHRGEAAGDGRWTYTHRAALRIGAVALAALVFIFWGQPTVTVVIVIAVLLLVVLGLIELIGQSPPHPGPAAPTAGG